MWTSGRTYPSLDSEHTKSRFNGYVVLVTGGCSGIGRAAVERFANDGAQVYALDINIQNETELYDKYSERVKCIQLDVSDAEKCYEAVLNIAKTHNNEIHTLVNSAAYFGSKGMEARQPDWHTSFDVNVVGLSNMVQAVVPFMPKGRNCSVVNLSSISGVRAQPDRWTYSATKGAISAVTRCMALDFRLQDIRVNAIMPSWVWSPEVAKAAAFNRAEGEHKWGRFFINGRLAEVEEVASVIAFLASKDASYITGADIPVDGGYLAIGPEQWGENSKFAGSEK